MAPATTTDDNDWMAGAEHPRLTPDWRREPCLGCGELVKRQRGAWSEIIGTRSGSWLAAVPVSAGQMVATDPENVPTSALMLGVAHISCLPDALARIRRGDVTFQSGLEIALLDTPPSVTPLNLPSSRTECLFCEGFTGAALTDEHVWPAWMIREFEARGVVIDGSGRSRPAVPVVQVCSDCNNRWLSVLENDCKPLLLRMWNEPTTLNPQERELLAVWATKTAITVDAYGSLSIPRGFGHDLRVGRRPSPGVWVWATAFVGPTRYAAAWGSDVRLAALEELPGPHGLTITFTAGPTLLQVMFVYERGEFEVDIRADDAALLMALWPTDAETYQWPPGGFDDEAAERLVVRFSGPDPDEPLSDSTDRVT